MSDLSPIFNAPSVKYKTFTLQIHSQKKQSVPSAQNADNVPLLTLPISFPDCLPSRFYATFPILEKFHNYLPKQNSALVLLLGISYPVLSSDFFYLL